jgi:hypothetical protein
MVSGEKTFSDELARAMARDDFHQLASDLDLYARWTATPNANWADEEEDTVFGMMDVHRFDPEKALAYLALAMSRFDDAKFLALLACGMLEDLLRSPSEEILQRVVDEARKSARFRWMLSHPFKVAVPSNAWEAIKMFRLAGPHEEPAHGTLPAAG